MQSFMPAHFLENKIITQILFANDNFGEMVMAQCSEGLKIQ